MYVHATKLGVVVDDVGLPAQVGPKPGRQGRFRLPQEVGLLGRGTLRLGAALKGMLVESGEEWKVYRFPF